MRLRPALAIAVTALLSALAPGCGGKDGKQPGEPLGTFKVTGKLVRSSCGPQPDPWEFSVKLGRDPGKIYWIQGDVPVQGTMDAKAQFSMAATGVHPIRAEDPKKRTLGCAIRRDDHVAGTLGPDPVVQAKGTLSYAFAATDGSDCTDQLSASGGEFETLPCEIHYEITAQRTELPKPAPHW